MILRFFILISGILALLAGCVGPAPTPQQRGETNLPPVRSVNVPPPVVQPPQAKDWIDWPIAPGFWIYRQDARGSIALFGPPNSDATITFRCDRQRQRIYLARAGNGAAGSMTIRTSSTLKTFTAVPTGGNPAYVATEIMPSDRILDAMSSTRGRIALENNGMTSIAVPIWSEVPRVIEDCRG